MSEPVAVLVPQVNPNDENAILVRWHVASGSRVAAGQPLATLETTKATFDVEAPQEGYAFFDHSPKTLVTVGTAIAWISDRDTRPEVSARPEPVRPTTGTDADARITRKALRLMKQHGLVAADFAGAGRVDAGEVERRVQEMATDARPVVPEDAELLEQSSAKMIEVQTLGEVYRHAIPSTVSITLSCANVDARLRQVAAAIGPISLLELAICEVAALLAEFPDLNGYYAAGRAWRHTSIAIGFAINLGRSLRVPVVKQAAVLSQLEIARRVRDLSLRYMRDELQLDDLTGGTFTITDLSGHGVTHFVPVLNQRQAAILGICAERPGTRHRDLVLTFDHRMADGMRAALLLGELRSRLETESQP